MQANKAHKLVGGGLGAVVATARHWGRAFRRGVRRVRRSDVGEGYRRLRTNLAYSSLVLVATLYAVFADDVRLAVLPKSADAAMEGLFYTCLGVFVVDIVLSVVFEPKYTRGTLFVLDIVATVSMGVTPALESKMGRNDARGLALARLARIVRLMRVMRVTRVAVVSSGVAMQQADRDRQRALDGEGAAGGEEHGVRDEDEDEDAPWAYQAGRDNMAQRLSRRDSLLSSYRRDAKSPGLARFRSNKSAGFNKAASKSGNSEGDDEGHDEGEGEGGEGGIAQRERQEQLHKKRRQQRSQSAAQHTVADPLEQRDDPDNDNANANANANHNIAAAEKAEGEGEGGGGGEGEGEGAGSRGGKKGNVLVAAPVVRRELGEPRTPSKPQAAQSGAVSSRTGSDGRSNGSMGGVGSPKVASKPRRPSGAVVIFVGDDDHPNLANSSPQPLAPPSPSLQLAVHRNNANNTNNPNNPSPTPTPTPTPAPSPEESRSTMGVRLLQQTTEKIILLVLALSLGIQLLELTIPDRSIDAGLDALHALFPVYSAQGCFGANATASRLCAHTACCEGWEEVVGEFEAGLVHGEVAPELVYLRVRDHVFVSMDTDLRVVEQYKATTSTSHVVVDYSSVVVLESWHALGLSLLFTFVLLVFPYLLGRDVLRLVITPLEVIYDRVQRIASNPFSEIEIQSSGMESRTVELDKISESLNRLTKLLQLTLGQAGSEIIARNLQAQGTFSALQEGQRVSAIYGFCDIRNFTDICEVLQEECVQFVNTIAAIIGAFLSRNRGAVNKNVGDAFLMVWKYRGDNDNNNNNNNPDNDNGGGAGAGDVQEAVRRASVSASVTMGCEAALRACVSIVRSVDDSSTVQDYATKLHERMGSDFRIRLGLGLHIGWAIEGALGSDVKIDATYLSPHVNLAMRLEADTKTYGVPLLMSHWFYSNLLPASQERCRRVDRVQLALDGGHVVTTLFAFEFGGDAEELIDDSEEYFELYVAGQWDQAKAKLEAFAAKWPDDKPHRALWDVLEAMEFRAPEDWAGYRCEDAKERVAAGGYDMDDNEMDLLSPRDLRAPSFRPS